MSGAARRASESAASGALHSFAVLCAAATFVLIFAGALVTSTGSGLSVPDWPLAYGKLVPNLAGGVRFEYGHRVVAGVVSLLTFALAGWIFLVEKRRWMRNTAIAVAALIIAQALLGAMNVLMLLPLAVMVAHSAIAQAFFCLVVALAVFTNPCFETAPRISNHGGPRLAVLAAITTTLVYLQILIGAVMRDLGAGLAIPDFPLSFGRLAPPFISIYVDINFTHRCGAMVVSVLVIWTVTRVLRFHREQAALRRPALGLLALLILQVTLGALTIWTGRAVIPTTSHVAVGAGVLATSLVLTIRAWALGGLAMASQKARVHPPLSKMERKVSA